MRSWNPESNLGAMTWLCLGLAVGLCAGCGGAKPPADAPESSEAEVSTPADDEQAPADERDTEAEAPTPGGLPNKCHKGGDPCVPPPKFVEGLCSDTYAAVALHMFLPSAPWTKAYLKGKVKAWNASGGVSDNEAYLEFDDEVVLLKIEWRFLDEPTQNALRESEDVTEAYRTRRQECKGAVSGTVSKKCVVADDALSQKIVDHVRGGGALGTPERMP
jgi:hypothetical protein